MNNPGGKITVIILILIFVIGGGLYFTSGGDFFQGKIVLRKASNTEVKDSKKTSDKASKKANEKKVKEENSKIAEKIMDQKLQECQKNGGIWNESEGKCLEALAVEEAPAAEAPAAEAPAAEAPAAEAPDRVTDFRRISISVYNDRGLSGYHGYESRLGSLSITAHGTEYVSVPSELRKLTFKIIGNSNEPNLLLTNIRMEDLRTGEIVAVGQMDSEGIIRFNFEPLTLPQNAVARNLQLLADIPENAPNDTFSVNLYINDSDIAKDFSFILLGNYKDDIFITEAVDAVDNHIQLPDNITVNGGRIYNNYRDIYLYTLAEVEIVNNNQEAPL